MSWPSNLIDHVARLDAAGLGRALIVDAGDQRAARRLDAEAVGDVVGDLLNAHAEPAAPRLAVLAQLIDHRHRGVGRHRKADADRAAGRRDDRGVDADDFAVEVEQRAAGIAAIDGGVGLNVIVVGAGIDVAVARRDDAGGHRAAEAERIADGDDPFAEPQLVGIAELHRLERLVGMHAQQRQVALGVLADQLRRQLGAVVEDDVDLVGVGDDVIIGDDEAGRIDDEAGAERGHAVRHLILVAGAAAMVLEELIEELFHRRAGRHVGKVFDMRIDFLRGRDIDHRVDDLFGDVGNVVGAARGGGGGPRRRQNECRGDRGHCDGALHAKLVARFVEGRHGRRRS